MANTGSTDLESGSSQYWSIADASQTGLDFTPPCSIFCWVKLETAGGGFNYVLVGKGSATGSTRQYRFGIRDNAGSKQMVMQSSSAGTSFDGDTAITTGSAWNAGQWYHVGVTVNGTSVKYWLDGAQHGTTQTSAISSYFNSTSPFSIGCENAGVTPAQFMDGLIDDVRIWARELSSSEITDLYNNPCTFSNGSNLVGWWQFDDGSGTSAADDSGNSNTLSASGSPAWSTDTAYVCGGSVHRLLMMGCGI